MSGHDNSFEAQMNLFYGKNIDNHLFSFYKEMLSSDDEKKKIAFSLLTFQLAIKEKGYLFFEIQDEVTKMQYELYNQLEKDRSKANK